MKFHSDTPDLDVLTEKGQQSIKDERLCAQLFEANCPGYKYVSTPKDKPADIDALIMHGADIMQEATAGDYDHLLCTVMRWVNVA